VCVCVCGFCSFFFIVSMDILSGINFMMMMTMKADKMASLIQWTAQKRKIRKTKKKNRVVQKKWSEQ